MISEDTSCFDAKGTKRHKSGEEETKKKNETAASNSYKLNLLLRKCAASTNIKENFTMQS